MKWKYIIIAVVILAIAAGIIFALIRNGRIDIGNNDDPVCGGIIDNSYDAPTVIKSKEITSFYTHFYRFDDSEIDCTSYEYKIKADGDSFKLIVSHPQAAECEITTEELSGLDKILKEKDVAKDNGKDRITSGLPPEFSPMTIKADYKSGEKLYVRENNNPQSELTEELVRYFNEIISEKS